MILFICAIPFLVAIALLIFWKMKVVWWEYCLLIIPSLIIIWALYSLCTWGNQFDTEYNTYYITKATYYEPWNEMKTRVVTYTTGSGKHRHTHHKTVHYVENHPETWKMTLNNEDEQTISEDDFNTIIKTFNSEKVFRNMNRHYFSKDGDAYDYNYDNDPAKIIGITFESKYVNPIQDSNSIFTYSNISKEEADELKLFEYPEIDGYNQDAILGATVPDNHKHAIDYLNAKYGKDKNIKIFVLFFWDTAPSIVEYQKSYWKGGNQNEFVICLGYNSKKKEINWADAFSWCDEPVLEAATKYYFLEHPKINLIGYAKYIEPYIQKQWKPKDFSEFKYIDHDISITQSIIMLIVILLYCGFISYFVVTNQEQYKEK